MRGLITKMEVGNEIGSDHFPVIATLNGDRRGNGKANKGRVGRNMKMGEWDKSRMKEFTDRMSRENIGIMEGDDVNTSLKKLRIATEKVLKNMPRRKEEEERRGWWDAECRDSKERLKEWLKEWRQGKLEKTAYQRKKREHENRVKEKKERGKIGYIEEVEIAIREGRVWEVINREKGIKKRRNEDIKMNEWTDYFKNLLGGMEKRVVGEGRKVKTNEDYEEISREEVNEAIQKMKRNKATGEDGMENEVLKYGGAGIGEEMWRICNKVWKGEGWPKDWRTGLVVPLVKKGEGKIVEEYRGITLMSAGYKVYAEILRNRLEKQVEEKEMIPHNQTGFRRGMGTIDNIFVLNYLVNRNLGRKGGKLVALFVDFKAAFDSVNRRILWKALKERGVEEGLIDRIKEIYIDTKFRVRIDKEKGEEFWTGRGVRQGCPLSPLLFSILLADLEEKLKKKGKGGVILGSRRVYSLAYADDVVLLADDERGMSLMMNALGEYTREKGLVVNTEKTKIVRFRKRRKKVEYEWKMNGKVVEEVDEFCYLGFWLEMKGGNELQVRKRMESASKVMGQVWGIGKRRFKNDWKMRVWMFDSLVWAVMGYGVEIWGWKEYKKVESMQERFLRWVMGVSWSCPGYMLREELGREKIINRQLKRAWDFEEKMKRGEGSKIAQECWREIMDRERRGVIERSIWERDRGQMRKKYGMEANVRTWQGIEVVLLERQRQERWKKIYESRYNRWYRMVKGEGVPEYLSKIKKESKWNRVIRFRTGESMKECRYWMNEEENKCRICEYERESWEHVLEGCSRGENDNVENKGVGEQVKWILSENGQGEKWMRELERRRMNEKHGEGKPKNDDRDEHNSDLP